MQGEGLALPSGLRVLLVEDEVLIALDCEAMLLRLGVAHVSKARSVADGLRILESETFDAAILDVQLGQELSTPLAQRLVELGVPFGFLTGFVDDVIPPEYRDRPLLHKPFDAGEVGNLMGILVGSPLSSTPASGARGR